jgi:hypothetical protein
MKNNIRDIAFEIDKLIRQHGWFDFYVLSNDDKGLIIAGSEDLTYYHTLEISFKDVQYFHSIYPDWHSDTKQTVFMVADNQAELKNKYTIAEDYRFFVMKIEGDSNDVIIAAKSINYNTDTVFYYDRPELKENERIADFVKKTMLNQL